MVKITTSKTLGIDSQQIRYEIAAEFQHPCYAMRPEVIMSPTPLPQAEIERQEREAWLQVMLDALEKHCS